MACTVIHQWHTFLLPWKTTPKVHRVKISKIFWRFPRHLFSFSLTWTPCAKVPTLTGFSPENSKRPDWSSPTWPGSHTHSAMPLWQMELTRRERGVGEGGDLDGPIVITRWRFFKNFYSSWNLWTGSNVRRFFLFFFLFSSRSWESKKGTKIGSVKSMLEWRGEGKGSKSAFLKVNIQLKRIMISKLVNARISRWSRLIFL